MNFIVLISEQNSKYDIVSSLLSYFVIPLQKGLLQCMLRQMCQCSIYLLHDKPEMQRMNNSWRLEGDLAQENSFAMNCHCRY